MALYLTKLVNGQVQKLRVSPTKALYRGYWAVIVGGFAGTSVTCDGTTKFIGSSERVAFNIITPGTYTFTATRQGTTITKEVVLNDDTQEYIINLSMFIGMQQVEYIESTGTQYIDTGVVPTETTVIDIVIGRNTSTEVGSNGLFGNDNVGARWNGLNEFRSGFGTSFWTSVTVSQQDKNHIIYEKTNPTFNNTSISISRGTVYGEETLYLYRITSSYSSTKIYSCKIYNNGTLVRDFVPIKDDTGHGALYDKVTQQIFYNSGTGDFICGPNYYTELEYIESTGTQYINTDIVPTVDMNYNAVFAYATAPTSGSSLLGSRTSASGGTGINYGNTITGALIVDFFGSQLTDRWTTNVTVTADTKYQIKIENKTATVYANDSVEDTQTFATSGTSTLPLFLCALNNADTAAVNTFGIRFYRFTIEGICDLIPCKNLNDVVGMYDLVTGTFFTNAGTGNFIAGPEK